MAINEILVNDADPTDTVTGTNSIKTLTEANIVSVINTNVGADTAAVGTTDDNIIIIFLFNFIRFVCGEQVLCLLTFAYADFTVGIYSTSTPFRVLAL